MMTALFALAVGAQQATTESPLRSMVATERAFAQASADKGMRDSFLMFIADDGILFRPTAVLGKKWLSEHPGPVTENRPLLAWQPIFADISAAGDMGYTYGPWEFKQSRHDQQAVRFGHFATIWKKQADGNWRFAIDLGITHPQSAIPGSPWEPPAPAKHRTKFSEVPVTASREALLSRDRQFSEESFKAGAVAAYQKFSAEDVRLFRNDHFPFVGKSAISEALREISGALTWQPAAADAARSGDLGYSYGTYEIKNNGAVTAKGNYMRFWKKQGGEWRLVLDVADPLPLEAKKN